MSFFKARAAATERAPRKLPWSEKYRPKTLSDVAGQDKIVDTLRKTMESDNLPHLLFYGPPGTGKTSTILALCKDLYGPEFKSRVLELNASDERGISVVRDKIKNFAKTVVSTPSAAALESHPVPPFKIIILDEADSMTQEAQSALRRTMETYSKITRFCLVCNYVTRIIDPLASRCSKFRFKPFAEHNALERLDYIVAQENVVLESEAILPRLLHVSGGDMRRAITLLQSAVSLVGPSNPVTAAVIDEVGGSVPESKIDNLLSAVHKKSVRAIQAAVSDLVVEGWSVTQLIDQLHDKLLLDSSTPGELKSRTALALSQADRRLTDGADEEIVLLNLCTTIAA